MGVRGVLAVRSDGTSPGREEALSFETLFEDHVSQVFRVVRRLLGPGAADADVDDVVQQVFVAAHRNLSQFRADSRISTWLYGIASRTVLTHLRAARRRRQMMARLEAHCATCRPTTGDLEREMEDELRLYEVWHALMKLSAKKRLVFILFEIEGRSAPEIAEIMGCREPTVRSRLHHARIELRRALGGRES